MTVKELIEQLQQVKDQDIEVIIQGTGPDSWVYMNDVENTKQSQCIMVEGEGLVEVDEDDINDEDFVDEIIEVFVIDGGMF